MGSGRDANAKGLGQAGLGWRMGHGVPDTEGRAATTRADDNAGGMNTDCCEGEGGVQMQRDDAEVHRDDAQVQRVHAHQVRIGVTPPPPLVTPAEHTDPARGSEGAGALPPPADRRVCGLFGCTFVNGSAAVQGMLRAAGPFSYPFHFHRPKETDRARRRTNSSNDSSSPWPPPPHTLFVAPDTRDASGSRM
eukprot:gene17127-biopygen5105